MNDVPSELVARLQEARLAAAAQMAALGGPTSACAMGRDGRPFPAYKYHEGQAAAYGDLVRALRRADLGEELGVVDGELERARAQVARYGAMGRDWESYAAGALDAALTARELLDAPDAPLD